MLWDENGYFFKLVLCAFRIKQEDRVLEIDREKQKAKKIKPITKTQEFNMRNPPMRTKKPWVAANHNFHYFHGVFTRKLQSLLAASRQ
jgi:hypothetical protein